MANKQRENFYRISTLITDNTKTSFVDLLELHLTRNGISFEDFINQHQHQIYHLCYNRRCCQCTPGYVRENNRILYYPQLEVLFDKSTKKSCHSVGSSGEFCCAKPKAAIATDDLDITLIRVLLVNFCNDIFWYSCLNLQSQSLEDFLNQNKHQIYHLREGNNPCCQCPPNYCFPVTTSVIDLCTWRRLFNSHQLPCSLHGHVSSDLVCTDSASPGYTVQNLKSDVKLSMLLIDQCCALRQTIDNLIQYRNKLIAHARVGKISDADYARYKVDIESGIVEIAKVCENEAATRQSLLDLTHRSLDETLCIQYQNRLLELTQTEYRIERVLTEVLRLIGDRNTSRQSDGNEERSSNHDRVTLIEDLASSYESSNESPSSSFKESFKTAFRWLYFLKDIDPKLSAVISTVEQIQNIRHDRKIGDVQKLIESRIDEELSYKYEGAKQYFIDRIVLLSEVDINEINEDDISIVKENVQPFKEVEYMAEMWMRIDKLKKNTIKRRNFLKLMKYIQQYVLLSILREIMLTMYVRILDKSKKLNVQRGIENLINLQSNKDRSLIQFLVRPAQDTLIFNFMYDPADWHLFDNLLNFYFPHQENHCPLDFLCTGKYFIKPIKYDDAFLFMADIACTWLRWGKKRSEQSEFTFKKKKIGEKTYFKIISSKWPEYHATIGKLGIWARGCNGTDDEDLFEILRFERNGEELYSFSPKDSRGYFFITKDSGRVYGSCCSACADTSFKIVSAQATSSMGNNSVV